MGLMKDRHGTYYARKKVPEQLQAAVARVLDQGKERQSFLKKSLGTKDLKAANIRAKPVLAGFDRVIRDATAIASQAPTPPAARSSLNAAEIARMSEALYGKLLADDEAFRFGGSTTSPLCQSTIACSYRGRRKRLLRGCWMNSSPR
jgi:hypothetical protein